MPPHANEQVVEESQSVSEILSDTFDELEAEEEELDAPADEGGEAQEEEAEEEVASEDEDAGEAETRGESEEEELLADGAEEPVEEYNEAAPERWPSEMRELYDQLPPNARQMLLEQVYKPMQRQYTQSTQELSQMRSTLEPMLQVMNQHSGELQSMGLDAPEAFRRQMAWASHFARVGPEQGIEDMRSAYGVQGAGQQVADDSYMTPVERSLKQQVDRMEQHLGQTQQQFSNQQQEQQQQMVQQATQAKAQNIKDELQAFVTEAKDGKPAHPHVDKVGHAMAGLIRGGLVEKFDEYGSPTPLKQQITQAYSLACQMDPSIRTVRPGKNNKEQVDAARRANRTVVSKNTGGANIPDQELSSDISDLWDKLDRRST